MTQAVEHLPGRRGPAGLHVRESALAAFDRVHALEKRGFLHEEMPGFTKASEQGDGVMARVATPTWRHGAIGKL